jgi:AraC-like DNA-binding protein
MVRQRTGANGQPARRCESCLQRRWNVTLSPGNQGRRFLGPCGVTNFCVCLHVGEACPVTLVLQAAVVPRSPSPRRVRHRGVTSFWPERGGEPVSPAAFDRAAALVRLILHDLDSTAQAWTARSGFEDALRRLNNAQVEAVRLRGELRHRLPGLPESPIQPGLGSRAQGLVKAMLDYVHLNGRHPIGLEELASVMKMNASYLSTLFSQTTGVTFHRFLAELRLSKAKELLRDPRNRVGEVACAAGYSSADSFRHAFKAHEGLSPAAWRAGRRVWPATALDPKKRPLFQNLIRCG